MPPGVLKSTYTSSVMSKGGGDGRGGWEAAMAEEWGDATVVTYDEEEWRALWKSNTYRPATNDVNEDEDEVDIDDI